MRDRRLRGRVSEAPPCSVGSDHLRRRAGRAGSRLDGFPGVLPSGPGQRGHRRTDPGAADDSATGPTRWPGPADRADRDDRAWSFRHHQPVLLRDHPGGPDGGGSRPATRCCSPTPRNPVGWNGRRSSGRCRGGRHRPQLVRMSDSAIRMTAKQRPVIVLNRAVARRAGLVTDNARGMRRAAEHLAELGHRRSPTSPARRPRGPTASAGGRSATRPDWTCAYAGSGPTGRPSAPGWPRPPTCSAAGAAVSPTTTWWRSA